LLGPTVQSSELLGNTMTIVRVAGSPRPRLGQAEGALEQVTADLHITSQTAGVLRHARGRLRFAQRRLGEALDDFLAAGEIASATLAVSPCCRGAPMPPSPSWLSAKPTRRDG
jgi:hypothetical protein